MKLQAVMENLHRQQRAKLLMELEQQQQQQQQQQAGQSQARNAAQSDPGLAGPDERMASPVPEAEHAQMAALAAMRAVAAGLQRAPDSPMSERSSAAEDEEEDDDDEEGEEPYKDMMGSEEEERIKQKWDEEDFEGEMEDDYEDDLAEEGVPPGRDAVMGKGILLLPHRRLHPHSQLIKPRPLTDQEPRVSALPPHGAHSQLGGGQDHGDWTYEEQFRQLYELDGDPKRKEFLDDLFSFMQKRGTPVNRIPIMAKQVLDLYMLYQLVTEKGGLVEVINKKLWREITKGLSLPTSITSAAFTLRTQYMKYLYPYECDKRGLSNPNELQAAIDSNRREGRRQSFGSTLFTYSPNGTPTMLSSPKLSMSGMGMPGATNGTALAKIKKEDEGGPALVSGRMSAALAGHSVMAAQAAAVQAAAAQAAMAAQVAALEQLRDKLEAGEPPEKKMALSSEDHQRLLQRALQHNLLAMTAQMPMNIRINNQDGRQDSALNLTTNGMNSISMSVELNGVVYTGVLFAQAAGSAPSGPPGSSGSSSSKALGGRSGSQPVAHTPTSSNNTSP
ncbi:AT-rich interactive domain-containing protein 3A [Conger conger]|uniref:AT-rich interactive domain-containing protein 3A n=1 Tax=Conger conger TaxID=82655 RepID=UPI002A5A932F|nr:AT-rich interactive domain-containing protein 3A [Conger conger]XP_061095494.1 AT-rich interactive domain-containing protein 3A [Conger conger]XP_061095495.1 AT-rich interactive domain-containing protein 3A [Conger conger]